MMEILELKKEFESRIYSLLPKAAVKISRKNWLSITINMPREDVINLRDNLLEIQEQGYGVNIKFTISKIQFKNYEGKYEMADLEEPMNIDINLDPENFQVDRKITWTYRNGIYKESTVTNFRITLFVKLFEKRTILKIEH